MKGAGGILKFCIIENPASCNNYVVDRFARGVRTYSYRKIGRRISINGGITAAAEISPCSLFYVFRDPFHAFVSKHRAKNSVVTLSARHAYVRYSVIWYFDDFKDFKGSMFNCTLKDIFNWIRQRIMNKEETYVI